MANFNFPNQTTLDNLVSQIEVNFGHPYDDYIVVNKSMEIHYDANLTLNENDILADYQMEAMKFWIVLRRDNAEGEPEPVLIVKFEDTPWGWHPVDTIYP